MMVFIIDDDAMSLAMLAEMIGAGFPGAEVATFTGAAGLLEHEQLEDADLFIIDIQLNAEMDGRELALSLPKTCRRRPFLFISGYPIEDDFFVGLDGLDIFDFIAKPFNLRLFHHRVGILLDIAPSAAHPMNDVYDLMMCAPYVAVVLDEHFAVRYCNQQAATLLGERNAAALVGRDWRNYVPDSVARALPKMRRRLVAGQADMGEFPAPVISTDGRQKMMRWFNTTFSGGAGETLTLSIGVSDQIGVAAIDKIRRMWAERIKEDKATIQNVRPLKPATIDNCELPP
jgi:CheY-like chemotaxis protein